MVEVDGMQVEVMVDELPQTTPEQKVLLQDGRVVALFDVVPQAAAAAAAPPADFVGPPADEPADDSVTWADGPWPKHKVCCEEWLG